MSHIYGIVLSEDGSRIDVTTPGVEAVIFLNWEKKEISVGEMLYKNYAIQTKLAEEALMSLHKANNNLREDIKYLRAENDKLIIENAKSAFPKQEEKEEEESPCQTDHLPDIPAPFKALEIIEADNKPLKAKKKKRRSRNKIDRSLVKAALLEYGKKRDGKFTFRITAHPTNTGNKEAVQEVETLQKETGYSSGLLQEAMKGLLKEGKVIRTKKRRGNTWVYVYEIPGLTESEGDLLKKVDAPAAGGDLN